MLNSVSVTAASSQGELRCGAGTTVASLPPTSPAATPEVSRPSSMAHLEENVAATEIALSADEFDMLSALGEQNA